MYIKQALIICRYEPAKDGSTHYNTIMYFVLKIPVIQPAMTGITDTDDRLTCTWTKCIICYLCKGYSLSI